MLFKLRESNSRFGRVFVGIGLILCVNAAVLGWTSTGNAQTPSEMSADTCLAYDLWSDSNFSPVFIGPLADSMSGVTVIESVRVSLNGLDNGQLNAENTVIATDVLAEYFAEACDGVDRTASPAAAQPTAAPELAATPAPEPTAAPEATATPEPTATPVPEPTAVPTAVFVPSGDGESSDSSGDGGATSDANNVEPKVLAQTGSGPLTEMLAFTGVLFILLGAAVMAVEAREPEFVLAYDNRVPKSERYFLD